MNDVADHIISQLAGIAQQLPAHKKTELLALLASWRKDVRQATRESYTELLNFQSKNGSHYGHARDVSSSGVFIETPAEFEIGESVKLVLTFISAPNPIKLTGIVVRIADNGIGLHFDSVSQSQIREMDSIISKHALILRQSK
ncbi:MAG: PilZ domain-containing protein [Mariprofundus sp.]|nr:PilZ domain-containing protein [Mariprofundus sp.]